MDWILYVFAAVGVIFVLYWAGATLVGLFGPKDKVGVNWINKILKERGVDPEYFNEESLLRVSKNALGVATDLNPPYGKYDAVTFRQELGRVDGF